MINQDRSLETGTDIVTKVRRKQEASPIKNSASLKFSLQEYASTVEMEKKNTFRIKQKGGIK